MDKTFDFGNIPGCTGSYIIFNFGNNQSEQHHMGEDRITVCLGNENIDLIKEEWEIYKDGYWSEDPVIRAMTIEVLKDKKNI